jgi:predicted secreted hydrolase
MATGPEHGVPSAPSRRSARRPGILLACALLAALLVVPALQSVRTPSTAGTPKNPSAGPDAAPVPDAGTDTASAWKAYPSTAGPFTFPDDEGLHPAALEEWWYVNGHLVSPAGDRYDFMVCFYKHGIVVASLLDESTGTYINHSETFLDIQREQGRLGLRFGPDELYQVDGQPFTYRLVFRGHDLSLELTLESRKAPLVVNGDGLISMGRGPSYYYSLTDLAANGTVQLGRRDLNVSGSAWMDRQWGYWSPALDWDWFSIKLDNGMQVLAYRILESGASGPIRLLVSVVDGQGNAFHSEQTGDVYQVVLGYDGYWRSPQTGKLYSSGWELTVPAIRLKLAITPVMNAQETLFPADTTPLARAKPFWEGACLVTGQLGGDSITGRAFVESTLDYGGIWGDLVITPTEYVRDGDHSRVVVMVENRGGSSIDNVEVQLVRGSPLEGGKILATYNLENRHNSTYLSSSLPNIGDAPLYIIVDPNNRMAESDEENNIAVAVLK